jgi:hypothetical protein
MSAAPTSTQLGLTTLTTTPMQVKSSS